jgi:hypothetical protein
MGKISCGGCRRAKVYLRSSPILECSRPMGLFPSLGRVFGDPRPLLEWHFLFGRWLEVGSLLWIILGGRVWWW